MKLTRYLILILVLLDLVNTAWANPVIPRSIANRFDLMAFFLAFLLEGYVIGIYFGRKGYRKRFTVKDPSPSGLCQRRTSSPKPQAPRLTPNTEFDYDYDYESEFPNTYTLHLIPSIPQFPCILTLLPVLTV